VIRIRAADERDVDVVVGRGAWQRDLLTRAEPMRIGAVDVPVVTAADLVLLKLYAGGSQDKWDIEQLLAADADGDVRTAVERHIGALPNRCRTVWSDLRTKIAVPMTIRGVRVERLSATPLSLDCPFVWLPPSGGRSRGRRRTLPLV
jgi:hypothetical protein